MNESISCPGFVSFVFFYQFLANLIWYPTGWCFRNLSLNPQKKINSNQLRISQHRYQNEGNKNHCVHWLETPFFLEAFTLDIQFLQFPLAAWNQAFRRKKWEEWALHAAWEASSKRHSWHLEQTRHTSPCISLCQEESEMNFFVLSSWILNHKVLSRYRDWF